MSDRWSVALAGCAALGALRPSPVPLVAAVALVSAALLVRHPALLCLGTLALVSSLATRSLAGLDDELTGPVDGEVTLLADPVRALGGVRADVRLHGRRLELRASGAAADALAPLLAGERVRVHGELQPVPRGAAWLTARHVAGRLRAHRITPSGAGNLPARAANALRRTLVAGAEPLGPVQRSLFTGLVIGDDRAQPPELADDFLGAGLTHLLAVSGQNVAFVLAVAGPVLRRLRIWPRLAATLALIAMFGLLTRFEPSVLRAAAMAALATTLAAAGSPVSRRRVLALAVTALLVVDPLLLRSVGFQLSASAAAAIVVAAPRLAAVLPGPAPVRDALAVTLAAQAGVAPVLFATFGPLPVASLPANLLAVPVAGLVMAWGLTGGLVAGLAGGWMAEVVHLPTRALLTWLAEVAARSAALPLGFLGPPHLAALVAGAALAAWGGSRGRPHTRRAGLLVAGAALAAAAAAAHAPPPLRSDLAPGIVRWHHGSTDVVVLGGDGGRSEVSASAALARLREAGVRAIDLLVVADSSVPAAVVSVIEARHPLGSVIGADGAEVPRAAVLVAGGLEVHLTATGERLVVEAVPVSR